MSNIPKSKHIVGNESNVFTNCNLSTTSANGRLISINEIYLAMAGNPKGEINLFKSNNNIPPNLRNNSTISLEKSNILDFEFSPFENNILSFGNENKSVYIIKIKEENKKIILDSSMKYQKHKNKVNFVKFNPVASNIICSSTTFGEVNIWDSIKFEPCIKFPEFKGYPTSVYWAPDGNLVGISTKKKFFNIFDTRQKKCILEKQFNEFNGKLVFDWIDSNIIVALGPNNKNERIVGLFDIRNQNKELNSYSHKVIDKESSSAIPLVDKELKFIYTVGKDKTPINIYEYSGSDLKMIYSYPVSQSNQFSVLYPRKYLDKKNFEIDRIIRSDKNIDYISFKIPKEEILYPDEESGKPLMSCKEWIEGKRMDQINLNEINNKKANLNNDNKNIIKKELNMSKDKENIIKKELKPKEEQKEDKNEIITKEETNKKTNNKENSKIMNKFKNPKEESIKLKNDINKKEERINFQQKETNLLKKIKEENDTSKKQQKDLNEKHNNILNELNENIKETEHLKNEQEATKSEKIKGGKNINELKEKYEKKKKNYENMKKENEEKDNKIKELLDKIKINEVKISKSENNIRTKDDIIGEYKKIIEENKIYMDNTKIEIEEKDTIINNKQNQIDELNIAKKKIEEESEKYKNEINNKNKEIDELKKQLKEENEQNKKLEDQINDININYEKKLRINEEFSKEIENYKNNISKFQLKFQEQKEKEEKYIEKINNYEQMIMKNNQEFNDKFNILEKENREKLSELESQNQQLKTKFDNIIIEKDNIIQDKENKIKNLENEIKYKNELIEKNENIITELKDELNQINDELAIKKEDIKKLNIGINNITAREIKKEKEIESLKGIYENKHKEELKKVNESLNEEFEEKLGKIKKEYDDKYKRKKNYDFEFIKIIKEIQIYLKHDIEEYSYECLNKSKLVLNINEGNKMAELKIALKNNGYKKWPLDSKLKIVKPSDFNIYDKILNPQNPNQYKTYILKIDNLENYPVGEYKAYLEFYSDGKNYGEKIEIKINIRENNERKKIIKEFKKEYNLDDKEYSDEKVLEILKNNDFDYIKSFSSMFNN